MSEWELLEAPSQALPRPCAPSQRALWAGWGAD
jgi:hypothetical protein